MSTDAQNFYADNEPLLSTTNGGDATSSVSDIVDHGTGGAGLSAGMYIEIVQTEVAVGPGIVQTYILEEDDDEALVSFWVDRSGNLMGPPEIVKHATNRSLGESGVRAIKLAAPLPPLPIEFAASEQQVVYAFGLVR